MTAKPLPLTLRETLALVMMQELVRSSSQWLTSHPEALAKQAVAVADAMIAELDQDAP